MKVRAIALLKGRWFEVYRDYLRRRSVNRLPFCVMISFPIYTQVVNNALSWTIIKWTCTVKLFSYQYSSSFSITMFKSRVGSVGKPLYGFDPHPPYKAGGPLEASLPSSRGTGLDNITIPYLSQLPFTSWWVNGKESYIVKVQPPLACDADARHDWVWDFIEASGIEVIDTMFTVDRYSRVYRTRLTNY
ncbi:hypothetical protein Tco_0497608 [Tanacetum coccineum]